MEEVPQTVISPKFKLVQRIKKFAPFILIAALLLLIGAGFFLIQIYQQVSANPAIYKAGVETLYYQDALQAAKEDNFATFGKNPLEADKNDKQSIINRYGQAALEQSLILQEGLAENLIKLDSKVFNSRNKDYQTRKELSQQVVKTIRQKLEKFTVQTLTIYFEKETDAAKAKAVMEDFRSQIISGKTSIIVAAGKIKKDQTLTSLSSLNKDPFKQFVNVSPGSVIFAYPLADDLIFQQKNGSLSPLIELNPSIRNPKTGKFEKRKTGYTLSVITSHTEGIKLSFNQWLNSLKDKYKTVKL